MIQMYCSVQRDKLCEKFKAAAGARQHTQIANCNSIEPAIASRWEACAKTSRQVFRYKNSLSVGWLISLSVSSSYYIYNTSCVRSICTIFFLMKNGNNIFWLSKNLWCIMWGLYGICLRNRFLACSWVTSFLSFLLCLNNLF